MTNFFRRWTPLLLAGAIGASLTLLLTLMWGFKSAQFATVDARELMSAAPNRYDFGGDPQQVKEVGGFFGEALQSAVRTIAVEEQVVLLAAGATLSENIPDFTGAVQVLVDKQMGRLGIPVKNTVAEQENKDATRVALDGN